MANTRELRRRIRSVKNTSQITKAMQMVAAAKMRKAQNQALNGRPYIEILAKSLERLLPKVDIEAHPLLSRNKSSKTGIVLLSTDKGLVGALNTNLMRTVLVSQAASGNVVFYTVGKKGRNFVVKTGKDLIADFENVDLVSLRQAVQLTKMITEAFFAEDLGEAYLIYPHFVSTLKQEPRKLKLLPIEYVESDKEKPVNEKISKDFLFEPNVDSLLDFILVHHIQNTIYHALLETKAAEHSARMIAMQNATDNAKEIVDDLTLNYNQTRQQAITTELLEITTAQVAMQ